MSFGKIDFAPKRECVAIKKARDLLSIIMVIIVVNYCYQILVDNAFVRHL